MKATMALLIAVVFASAAAAHESEADHLITKGTGGIDVYAVTEHGAKLLEGSPFFPTVGPNMISDGNHDVPAAVGPVPILYAISPDQDYLYALYSVQYINGSATPGGALYAYRITRGVPKVVSFAIAGGYGGPPHYYTEFNFIVASEHYVFVSDLNGEYDGIATISVYTTSNGVLSSEPISGSGVFAPYPPIQGAPLYEPIGLQVDADESLAYVSYIDNGPRVAIYSLKCGAFTFLRSIAGADLPLLKSHATDQSRRDESQVQEPRCNHESD